MPSMCWQNPERHCSKNLEKACQDTSKRWRVEDGWSVPKQNRKPGNYHVQVAWGRQLPLRIVNCRLPWRKPFLQCSPLMVSMKEPKLSANFRPPCQFACSTLRNDFQSRPHSCSVLQCFTNLSKTWPMKCQTVRYCALWNIAECFHFRWWIMRGLKHTLGEYWIPERI